jgi:hypothetical protein
MTFANQKINCTAGDRRSNENKSSVLKQAAAAIVCLALALCAAPALAADVVIDDFLDDSPLLYDIGPNNMGDPGVPDVDPAEEIYLVDTVTAAAIGGIRTMQVRVDERISPLEIESATGVVGDDSFKFLTSPNAGADASLIYAPAANSPAFDLVDGTNSGFLLSFDSIDGGVDDFIDVSFLSVDIFVGSAVGPRPPTGIPGPTGEAQWLSDPLDPAKSINESASPFEFFIPFDDFETTDGFISFSDIKSIQVDFNYFDPMDDDLTAIQGVDFKLTSIIATVPEPSSMALAALGLLASFIGTSRTRRRRRD